jgi:hypothetical protein
LDVGPIKTIISFLTGIEPNGGSHIFQETFL